LPNEPGVYRFLRSNGDVLYVGKATSLSKRTASHFSARAAKQQAPEMLTQVHDIQVTVVASALEAALLEHDTIVALRPPYNVQLSTSDTRVWYASRDFDRASAAPDETHTLGPLPSEFSLRALGAQTALVAGASSSRQLRAAAVGISGLWTPDEAVFAAGLGEYSARHGIASAPADPRRSVLALAKKLLLARALGKVEEGTPSADADDKRMAWDPERVARHLERAVAQAYQLYRRARWLRLLYDCDIVYREPESTRTRLLLVRNGQLLAANDTPSEISPPAPPRSCSAAPRAYHFDRTTYDRLRILGTELKRIQRDGGLVTVFVGVARRALTPQLLSGIQRLV
jgi:hypothetical protein